MVMQKSRLMLPLMMLRRSNVQRLNCDLFVTIVLETWEMIDIWLPRDSSDFAFCVLQWPTASTFSIAQRSINADSEAGGQADAVMCMTGIMMLYDHCMIFKHRETLAVPKCFVNSRNRGKS